MAHYSSCSSRSISTRKFPWPKPARREGCELLQVANGEVFEEMHGEGNGGGENHHALLSGQARYVTEGYFSQNRAKIHHQIAFTSSKACLKQPF